MKKIVLVAIVLVLVYLAGLYGWQSWHEQQRQLEEAQAKIVQTENQLEDYRIQAGRELDSFQKELGSMRDKFDVTQNELGVARTQLQTQEIDYEQRIEVEREIGYKTGYEKGKDEILESGILLKKPTLQELAEKQFINLDSDRVVIKPYIPGEIVCVDIVAGYNNAAVMEGFQVGAVMLVYSYPNGGKWGHFINAFRIEDGIIYVEPQTERVVQVEIGKSYSKLNGFDPDPDDIIKEIIFFW